MKPSFAAIVSLWAALAAPGGSAAQEATLAGSLDLAYSRGVLRDAGDPPSQANTLIKDGSPFSLARARFFIDAELGEDLAVFTTTLFDQGMGHFDLEGAYLVWSGGHANWLVGKQAAAFGTFAARSFATANPLIGTPLVYHYFTAVQGDRAPTDAAQQLAWRERLEGPSVYGKRGQPIVYDSCWNTGVQIFGGGGSLSYAVAVISGALSNPEAAGNDGFQALGRLGWEPRIGLRLGVSGAYGPYLEPAAENGVAFPRGKGVEDYNQAIAGVDFEYSFDAFEFFAEALYNRWEVPNIDEDLSLAGGYVEGRYTLRPGFYGALRYGRIDFGTLEDGTGRRVDWDYDIQRLEVGAGYYLGPQVRAKAVMQFNGRAGPPGAQSDHLVGLQLASTF